ncbi:MAG TPA: hypothetical protein VF759_16680 [Allosphingosinicella sp.]
MIAALVAAQLAAVAGPARAAEPSDATPATEQSDAPGEARLQEDSELSLGGGAAAETQLASAEEAQPADSDRPDKPRKKGKSTGDKVLTGAAVILGVGALAVGGLLVAIFVN